MLTLLIDALYLPWIRSVNTYTRGHTILNLERWWSTSIEKKSARAMNKYGNRNGKVLQSPFVGLIGLLRRKVEVAGEVAPPKTLRPVPGVIRIHVVPLVLHTRHISPNHSVKQPWTTLIAVFSKDLAHLVNIRCDWPQEWGVLTDGPHAWLWCSSNWFGRTNPYTRSLLDV